MNPRLIPAFVNSLSAFGTLPLPNTANPYLSPGCCTNLSSYLIALCNPRFSGVLLVGEAPGYRGCAITGIPFTSERVLTTCSHHFLIAIRPSLTITGMGTERTATIVWKDLCTRHTLPAFWNAFPFHPHVTGNLFSNRAPTAAEIAIGTPFLTGIINILCPHIIIGVGKKAGSVLSLLGHHLRVPHPSYRGASGYKSGIARAGIR